MRVTWHSFDLRTGRRGQQLVTAKQGEFGRIIAEPTESQVDVSCWDTETETERTGWNAGTFPGRTMLVALDAETDSPLWGGMVLRRRSTASQWVTCTAVTLEHYLSRRFVGDLTFTGVDQASIAAGIVDDVAVDGLDFTVDAPASGVARTRVYKDNEDKTALAVLTELMEVNRGLEFTVDLAWADAEHTVLERILRFRRRLGTAPAYPIGFTMPGPVNDFEFIEDYSPDFGANDVLAVSSGQGDVRPVSDHQVDQDALDAGWARFEDRFTPSTSITDKQILNAAAEDQLERMRLGIAQLQLEANLSASPRVDVDFFLGDDVTVTLTCPRFPRYVDADGLLQPGFSDRARCVGWTVNLDDGLLKPLLRGAGS